MAKTSSFVLLLLLLVCVLLAYLYYDAFSANNQLEARMNELQVSDHVNNAHLINSAQKKIRSLRIDKEDIANQLSDANGRELQMSHKLEAEKGEVQVKTAEVKKLTERINTLREEQEMSQRARITAERKMVSFAAPPTSHCIIALP